MKTKNKIGLQIMLARKEKGFTQSDLADKMYCTRQTIMTWENGSFVPSIKKIQGIAKLLGKDISFFISPDITDDVEKLDLYLPQDLATKVRKSAKKEQVSESDLIRQILEDWVDKKTV